MHYLGKLSLMSPQLCAHMCVFAHVCTYCTYVATPVEDMALTWAAALPFNQLRGSSAGVFFLFSLLFPFPPRNRSLGDFKIAFHSTTLQCRIYFNSSFSLNDKSPKYSRWWNEGTHLNVWALLWSKCQLAQQMEKSANLLRCEIVQVIQNSLPKILWFRQLGVDWQTWLHISRMTGTNII